MISHARYAYFAIVSNVLVASQLAGKRQGKRECPFDTFAPPAGPSAHSAAELEPTRTGEAPIGSESRCHSRDIGTARSGAGEDQDRGRQPGTATIPQSDRLGSPVRKRAHYDRRGENRSSK
jgi:hypothetical protein